MNADTFEAHLQQHAETLGPERLIIIRAGWADARERARRELEQHAAYEAAARARRQAAEEKLYEQVLNFIPADIRTALPSLPDPLRQAVSKMSDYGLDHAINIEFWVDLPEFAPIWLTIKRDVNGSVPYKLELAVNQAKQGDATDFIAPKYQGLQSCATLPELLYVAAAQAALMDEYQREYIDGLEAVAGEEQAQRAALAADERRQTAEQAAKELEERAAANETLIELERLAAWAKSDPAVLNLIRAFIAVEEQRQSFADRLNAADQAAGDAWSHFENRSAELRREADAARAEADRQRRAARDAEYEAEKARDQIKDAERRANSYHRSYSW